MGAVDKLWQRQHRTLWAGYPAHPAADAFPLMDGEELDGLVDSIRATDGDLGLNKLVVGRVDEGPWQLIDGRNRIRAMQKLGVEIDEEIHVVFQEFGTDAEVWAFVYRQNFHRRQLTPSQLAHYGSLLKDQFQAMLDGGQRPHVRGAIPSLTMTPEEEEEWMNTAPDAPIEGLLFSSSKLAAPAPEEPQEPVSTATETPAEPEPNTATPESQDDAQEPAEPAVEAPKAPQRKSAAKPKPKRLKPKRPKSKKGEAAALAAKATGGSVRSIYRASKIRADGVPELAQAVSDGRITAGLASLAVRRLSEQHQRVLARTGLWPEDVPKVSSTSPAKPPSTTPRLPGRPQGAIGKKPQNTAMLQAFQEVQKRLKHKRRGCIANQGIDQLVTTVDWAARTVVTGAGGRGEHRGGRDDLLNLITAAVRLFILQEVEAQRESDSDAESENDSE